MGMVKKLFRCLLDIIVVSAIILFVPGVPPYGKFDVITVAPPRRFEGALEPGDYALNKAEKLFEGQLVGPESLELSPVDPDVFYTTLQGGAIVKISNNGQKMEPVAKFGNRCEGLWDAQNCGRPLGIRFDSNGHLIAGDSYLGIFKIDFEKGKTSNLVSRDTVVDGKTAKTFNSVAPAKDGKIYYTVSSTNYPLHEGLGEMFGEASGRLMVYDPQTEQSKVLQENVHFANGIVLSPNEDYIVFAECFRYRLLKHHLKGPKAGQAEVFIDGLPGNPDNLSFSPDGNIFVGLVSVRLPGQFNPMDLFYQHPWLRKLLLRTLHMVKAPFDFAAKYSDLPILRQISYHILNMETMKALIPPYAIIVEVDWNGKILNSWHSNSGDRRLFCEAKIINGYMYLASPYNDYLGRVRMPDSVHFVKQPVLTLS